MDFFCQAKLKTKKCYEDKEADDIGRFGRKNKVSLILYTKKINLIFRSKQINEYGRGFNNWSYSICITDFSEYITRHGLRRFLKRDINIGKYFAYIDFFNSLGSTCGPIVKTIPFSSNSIEFVLL